MEKYTIQYHSQQIPTHLNFHWDTLTICQLKCPYCYARNIGGKDWGKITSIKTIDKVIEAMSRSTLPFNLGLLGGEPTIGPHYNYILDKVSSLSNNSKIYVTTNAEKDLSLDIIRPRLSFLFSYHPGNCTSEEMFLKNVYHMKNNNIKLKVNIILHPKKEFWQKSLNMAIKLKEIGVKIHPHFLYNNWDRTFFKYQKEFWDTFKIFEDEPKELFYNEDCFNDYEVYKLKLTNFEGWNCYHNNYEIDVHGRVVQMCKQTDERSDLNKDLDYFKNIDSVKPIICQYKECNCDGLLKQLKVKHI